MKVIAVLIPSFTTEYSLDILSGISDYFRDKDVKVVIIQTRIPGVSDLLTSCTLRSFRRSPAVPYV